MRRTDGGIGHGPGCGRALGSIAVMVLTLAPLAVGGDEVDFDRRVSPVLAMRCLECHGVNTASGGLVLTSAESLARGGDAGEVVVAGKPEESALLERVIADEMPPKRQGQSQKLSEPEIQALRAWIAAGAKWPKGRVIDRDERTTSVRGGRDWWSLQPIARPTPPSPRRTDWVKNPIDAFVLAKLESAGIDPAPQSDRRVLIRRAYFDLVGLPPTIEEVDAFVKDSRPDAYERLIARLLESPHYGERWGRFWLDLARFAETSGYERDQEKPGAWKYRDWVVKSLNDDKPYDRFVLEQLAGDELPDRDEQTVVATGFLRLGTWNDEPNDPQDYKYERLEDMVHATTTAFLGMTVKCARCHDHKFDPIPQTDYYRIAATFWPGPIEPRERELLGGPSSKELDYDVLGWTDVTRTPSDLHLLKKGEHTRPGQVVAPGVLSMIPDLDRPIPPPPADAKTTRRRLTLAEWINDPRHPLAARVYVNRIWQHHFGRGLVSTSDNFGFTGQKPSHPELLDWLAAEFLQGGRKSKRMHYLMMTSSAYQQASSHPEQESNAQKDADNRLIWHGTRQRQDAEALRDAILAVSGRLDLRVGGPSFKPVVSAEALEGLSMKGGGIVPSPPEEQNRRSLYMYSRRGLLAPLMTTFDFCDTTLPCGQRDVSVVAPQALALLNGDFAHEQSDATARRVGAIAGRDASARVRTAWRIVLARDPSAAEATAALRHLDQQKRQFPDASKADDLALASLCHVLINSNEFVFVD
ncbi:MAG: PSD1 and planctomycete cytochrome C domain-containing protein [Paludisphaera borealis]|uniref:PSD1 and planctomycete cytochrome C domain-containing protein n=1 Tax=Paludisphaera borealis TaxID=1387353 RepID=UPI0028461356|nr:PSD1 and planctomycete cytochrome C domain-containing protein [Paludisphaera borealis]MDR3623201.1 PSD1 and planctomycete cytochrome C domain-containing protein [Paludisphaera borealis]